MVVGGMGISGAIHFFRELYPAFCMTPKMMEAPIELFRILSDYLSEYSDSLWLLFFGGC
jgi:hypothetical protein